MFTLLWRRESTYGRIFLFIYNNHKLKMAEYWKSLPRKFCDVCKCWFADNKASIEFHERGKRHQENAQKRIQNIQKKGIKDFKKQKELENEMAKIEKAALAAYERDLKNLNSDNSSQSSLISTTKLPNNITAEPSAKAVKSSLETVQKKIEEKKSSINSNVTKSVEPPFAKVWFEGITEEGYKYYWNSETSESRWESPQEDYVSIEEQNNTTNEEQISVDKQESKEDTDEQCIIGPQPKYDPYGQWEAIKEHEPVEYDFQLPKQSEDIVEVVIPIYRDEPLLKFKEKVVGQLSDSEPGDVTFKKRKLAGSYKRNARQRITNDD